MRCSRPTTAIASELSLESLLLQRLVTTAAELMGARYAALGVIDRSGRQLERFPGMSVRVREVVEREPEGTRVDDAPETGSGFRRADRVPRPA